ncbi:hypothetical protein [Undibacterium terreum]|uniref:Uncharacterized protein n=1 Tax=Undibacterium terreum TaxID=1224302 RepID=A0A916XQ94_9BURK|nr:hypothetical protein [Undibacterium terreum]GGC95501.1 hypothetical protein GCM10011396_48590 [Undibacterium terreum]
MKTESKFQVFTVLTGALVGAVFVAGSAFHNAAGVQAQAEQIPTVTITAKRMTNEEKHAYDMEQLQQQASVEQTVFITAKRLTAEQKQAMLEEELRLQSTIAKEAMRTAQKAG